MSMTLLILLQCIVPVIMGYVWHIDRSIFINRILKLEDENAQLVRDLTYGPSRAYPIPTNPGKPFPASRRFRLKLVEMLGPVTGRYRSQFSDDGGKTWEDE